MRLKSSILVTSFLVAVHLILFATNLFAQEETEPVDLTDFYGRVSGTQGDTWFSHPDWENVPKGLQLFDGVYFDVSGNKSTGVVWCVVAVSTGGEIEAPSLNPPGSKKN